MKSKSFFVSNLFFSFVIGLGAQAGQSINRYIDNYKIEFRDLNYVLSENGCVTAVHYTEAQFNSALGLIGNYKNAIELPLEKMMKAEEEYKKAQKEKSTSTSQLKALFAEFSKAEASIEILDHQLQMDLYSLFSGPEKANLKIKQQKVDDYRKLIVDSDKTVLDCTGALIANYGIVAALYNDNQFDAFKKIVKGISDNLKSLGQKKTTADINYMNIYGIPDTTPQQLEAAFNAVKNAEFEFSKVARKRDLDLMGLLSSDQKSLLKAYESRIEKYMDKFVTGYDSIERESERDTPAERITVWLISRYGCNMATLFDDAQYKKALEVIEKNNADIKPLKKSLSSAKLAYKKALVDPACTGENFKKAFDEMSRAEYAVELMEHNLTVNLQLMLTNEQAQKLDDNMARVEEFTNLIVSFDDSFNGSCNYPNSNTGIVATVYDKTQYDSSLAILKNSNKELEPLMNKIASFTKSYAQLHASMSATSTQIENAFLDIKNARFEHAMATRARDAGLSKLLSAEQQGLLNKHELRIKVYLAAMKK